MRIELHTLHKGALPLFSFTFVYEREIIIGTELYVC